MWVIFDGFDESASRISSLAATIESELKELLSDDSKPLSRLFLRFGSRSTGWEDSLGNNLTEIVGSRDDEAAKGEYCYQLAPLSQRDIQSAAVAEGVDDAVFWEQLVERNLQTLAMRPNQLNWLLSIFTRGGELPSNVESLFWEGVRQTAITGREPDQSENFRASASRIAFAWIFGHYSSIQTSPDRGDVDDGVLLLTALSGGSETTSSGDVDITSELLTQTINSGLFTRIDDSHVVWAHQTYPEFLAAHYLTSLQLPVAQIVGLITNPNDPVRKVIPGMTEVSAWLASMSEDVLSYVLEHDPETLVESDVALTSSENRKRLLVAYLAGLDEQRILPHYRLGASSLRKLCFNGVNELIERVLLDRSRSFAARSAAADIAVQCDLSDLGSCLADIATSADEDEALRRGAAYAVVRVGDRSARQMLKPLLDLPDEEDAYDDLRGQALTANWPEDLTVEEVVKHLGPPRWDGIGSYHQFLVSTFPASLSPQNVLPVLKWFGNQSKWDKHWHEWERLEEGLMDKALDNLENPDVFDWFVSRVGINLLGYRNLLGGTYDRPHDVLTVLDDPEIRRALWVRLSVSAPDAETINTIAYSLEQTLWNWRAWLDSDFDWMVRMLRESDPGSMPEAFWLHLVSHVWYWNIDHMALIFELSAEDRFSETFAEEFAAIEIQSVAADKLRASYNSWQPEPRQREEQDDIDGEVQRRLETIESGHPAQWWLIDNRLQFDVYRRPSSGLRDGPVPDLDSWRLCSQLTQQRVRDALIPFLESFKPHLEVVGTNDWYQDDQAAFWALVWLLSESPSRIEELPPHLWIKLGPVVLGGSFYGREQGDPRQALLLELAVANGFDPMPWIRTMVQRAPQGTSYRLGSGLRATVEVLIKCDRQDALDELAASLISADVSFEIALEAARIFYQLGYARVYLHAASLATSLALLPGKNSDTARLLTTMMSYLERGQWNEVQRIALSQDGLLEEVALGFGHWHHDESRFESVLTEAELCSLYTELLKRFPRSEDIHISEMHGVSPRESLGRWRDDLLRHAARRGTWVAVQALRRLAAGESAGSWIRYVQFEAEDAARLATWRPPTLEDLVGLMRHPKRRLISNAEQLQEVILESLARLQVELHAPTPGAESWWNHPHDPALSVPRSEEECSNEIQRHFERDLAKRMVLSNREVRSSKSNIKDILVEVMVPGTNEDASRISVVCEVKGCWNRDLMTSIEGQLLGQYLKQEGYSHGIYIVAFFDSDRWEKGNRNTRHKRNKRHTLESLSGDLGQQADRLSVNGKTIRVVVLDANFQSGPAG